MQNYCCNIHLDDRALCSTSILLLPFIYSRARVIIDCVILSASAHEHNYFSFHVTVIV